MSDNQAYFQRSDTSDDGNDDAAVLRRARTRFEWCEGWEANARNHFKMDIRFGTADAYNMYQWDNYARSVRELVNKPMLTINKTQVHCRQIVNDARQNRSDIEVRPVGNEATEEAAQIYEGIIRHINYQSDSQAAYDTATWFGVFGGWGYVRVHVDYMAEDTWDQDIFIKRVPDPLTIYHDPRCEHFDISDARFAFVFSDEDRKKAEAEYGKLPEVGDLFNLPPTNNADPWNAKETVRICEYFERGDKTDVLLLLADGTSVRKSALPKDIKVADLKRSGNLVRTREISEPEVMWYLIVGDKIVDKKAWMGKYIPIARMVGEETVIDGQLDRKGHVRNLIDPQRMYNYNSSGSVEFIGGQTKTPWLVDVRAIDGYETIWNSANTQTTPYLPRKGIDGDGNPIEKPERIDPPAVASAHIEGMKTAQEEMMMASGQYQAVLGEPSNETSGKAINARQRQGDNATYHFIDHQASMIRHVGRICLDLIPKVYDSQRVLQVLGQDGELTKIMIDPSLQQGAVVNPKPQDGEYTPNQISAVLNPKVGKFDLIADIGPSYATQRQEAFNAFSQIMAQNKEAFTIVGDLWAKAADFPGSDALADRLKNMVPQQALGGPSPEMQQLQQHMTQMAQAGQQQIEMLHNELQAAKKKLDDQAEDLRRKDYEAETNRMKAVGSIDPEAFKPVIRELVSQALATPIVPLMDAHAAADQARMPPEPEPAGGENGV